MQPTVIHARDTSTTSPVAIAVGACLALMSVQAEVFDDSKQGHINADVTLSLYGQVSQGAYQYFRRYPKDGYDLKAIVRLAVYDKSTHAQEKSLTMFLDRWADASIDSFEGRVLLTITIISMFHTIHTVCVTHVW